VAAIRRHLVVTTCTNRKRAAAPTNLLGRVLPAGKPRDVARAWSTRLGRAERQGTAKELYLGRAFREAERAAETVNAEFFVLSAGLGLVPADMNVPSYNLTLAQASPDSILAKTGSDASVWWQELKLASVFHKDLPPTSGLILFALSEPYLEMIGNELSGWSKDRRTRLRLFIKQNPSDRFPKLADQWMPYDDRIDALGGDHAGTQGDFAQRAMRHFAEHFCELPESAAGHAARVKKCLAKLVPRERPARVRVSDQEAISLIERDWDIVQGRSGRMLRRFRDDLNLGCEQSRFKRLFLTVQMRRAVGE